MRSLMSGLNRLKLGIGMPQVKQHFRNQQNLSHVRPLLRMLLKVQRSFQKHEHKHQPLVFGPASLIGGRLTSERKNDSPGLPTRLPTMSIEEAGSHEMEMMQKWQERNSKFMEEANSSWPKEGTRPMAEEEVAEVEKARA